MHDDPTRLRDLFVELSQDTVAALKELSATQAAFDFEHDDITKLHLCYRTAARLFCSQADATVFLMKEKVAQNLDNPRLSVSRKDRDWIERSPDKARFAGNLKVAFRYFPRLVGLSGAVSFGGEGYRAFRRLVDCREFISHPTCPDQFFSLELLGVLKPGVEWFLLSYEEMLLKQLRDATGEPPKQAGRTRSSLPSDARSREFQAKTRELIDHLYTGTELEQFDWFALDLAQDFCLSLATCRRELGRSGLEGGRWAARALAMAEFAFVEGLILASGAYLSRSGLMPLESPEDLLGSADEDFPERLARFAEDFSATSGPCRKLKRSGAGWSALVPSRLLRDRCVHPRRLSDLVIDSQDLVKLEILATWLFEDLLPLFRTVRA